MSTQQARDRSMPFLPPRSFNSISAGANPSSPDFLDLMDYAHDKGIVTCISTNGTLITAEIAARLDHPLVYIQVSLDGGSPESNDAIRGEGTYHKVFRALELLRHRDIEVSINTVLTRRSFRELDKLANFLAASYGAKFRCSRFWLQGRGKQSWAALNVSREQMLAFSDWLSRNLSVSTGDSFFGYPPKSAGPWA